MRRDGMRLALWEAIASCGGPCGTRMSMVGVVHGVEYRVYFMVWNIGCTSWCGK